VDLSRGRISRRFSPCCPAKKFMPLNTIRSLFFRVFFTVWHCTPTFSVNWPKNESAENQQNRYQRK
jgi:hypothetical protein